MKKPNQIVEKLMAGNQAYLEKRGTDEGKHLSEMPALRQMQNPAVCVVSCADSRVDPERIFDAGPGELFVYRSAGNMVNDPDAIATVEYAVQVLGVGAIVVLGHSDCGAVQAALDNMQFNNHLAGLVDRIRGNLGLQANETADLSIDAAVQKNVGAVVAQLQALEPTIKEFVAAGELAVLGAKYHFETDRVTFI